MKSEGKLISITAAETKGLKPTSSEDATVAAATSLHYQNQNE